MPCSGGDQNAAAIRVGVPWRQLDEKGRVFLKALRMDNPVFEKGQTEGTGGEQLRMGEGFVKSALRQRLNIVLRLGSFPEWLLGALLQSRPPFKKGQCLLVRSFHGASKSRKS